MSACNLPPLHSPEDLERIIEFEFVRATENAALQAIHWLGRGEKEKADAVACAAIAGIFDMLDVRAQVVIGEGIKDQAPGLFVGEKLGTWKPGTPRFDIALDPIDGTSNLSKGLPNSISVIAAAQIPDGSPHAMQELPTFYSHKVAYGPEVRRAIEESGTGSFLDMSVRDILEFVAKAKSKRLSDLVVMTMDRPRHLDIIRDVRECGAALRMISDGDITAAIAPSMPNSGIDLYLGMGGSPEGVLAAAALKCLGGDMQLRMWCHNEEHRKEVAALLTDSEIQRIYTVDDLVVGDSALFCATGISDSDWLSGVKVIGHHAETHSILMRARSGTMRHIKATHNLDRKLIQLRENFMDLIK